MFSVITNIYNKKTKRPALMELFTATGKLNKFFWQLEMFDVCTAGDTAHRYDIQVVAATHTCVAATEKTKIKISLTCDKSVAGNLNEYVYDNMSLNYS
jgi:hypothetical protein